VRGAIRALPLVEGEYNVGLGLGSTNYFGDSLGLRTLRVHPRPPAGDVVPYAAQYRGVLELELEEAAS
jgi:hypothetical protein